MQLGQFGIRIEILFLRLPNIVAEVGGVHGTYVNKIRILDFNFGIVVANSYSRTRSMADSATR